MDPFLWHHHPMQEYTYLLCLFLSIASHSFLNYYTYVRIPGKRYQARLPQAYKCSETIFVRRAAEATHTPTHRVPTTAAAFIV